MLHLAVQRLCISVSENRFCTIIKRLLPNRTEITKYCFYCSAFPLFFQIQIREKARSAKTNGFYSCVLMRCYKKSKTLDEKKTYVAIVLHFVRRKYDLK